VTLRTLNILLEKPLADALKSKNKDVQSLVNMQNKPNNMGATNLVRTTRVNTHTHTHTHTHDMTRG
jgi:hypothetical protein